jgi:hypothetical protein
MKKSLFALLMMASFALTFTGCKKDEEDTSVVLTNNTFAIDGVKLEGSQDLGALYTDALGLLLATSDNKTIVSLKFGKKPTTSGTYSFKGLAQSGSLGDNDAILSVSYNSKVYSSNPSITEKATITVADSLIGATIPKITLSETGGTSITFEGKLLQY